MNAPVKPGAMKIVASDLHWELPALAPDEASEDLLVDALIDAIAYRDMVRVALQRLHLLTERHRRLQQAHARLVEEHRRLCQAVRAGRAA
jgi:hypothetical protein